MTTKIDIIFRQNRFRIGIIPLIFIIILSSCSFPIGTEQSSTSVDNNNDLATTAIIDVVFRLQLPTPLIDGEEIFLEILDDVSGIPNNIRRYQLTQIDDLEFKATLNLPSDSVVKYRYIKTGAGNINESTLFGDPIRYRMFYAGGRDIITDVLQTWEGERSNINPGRFIGTIFDQNTNQPVPDILISAGGQLTFSDANGKFVLENLSPGIHNALFYAMNGQYKTYQQGASIDSGLTTPAEIQLIPMKPVAVTLEITTPQDALGAPIYIAGNLSQLGNTFASLPGSMSILPKRMPMLVQEDDGTFSITLQLYEGADLRYKFTLGDGFWNSEQHASGGLRIRQLIVPDHDVTISHTIATWRSQGVEPITFDVSIPPETSPIDEKYIQFKTTEWTNPIPLWPLGNSDYLYILFSPTDDITPISYRFCRNSDCQNAKNFEPAGTETSILPSTEPQVITTTVDNWDKWVNFTQPTNIRSAQIQSKPKTFSTMIELTPEMDPTWPVYFTVGISKIKELRAETIIFSPQWQFDSDTPSIVPLVGITPFHYELVAMLNTCQSMGFDCGVFPQIGPAGQSTPIWDTGPHSEDWWANWFESYQRFIVNYAKTAEQSGVSFIVLGGKSVLPAFSGGHYPDGRPSDVPETSETHWLEIISDIRENYSGNLIWATNINNASDPMPKFIDEFDAIYISVDSPLTQAISPSFEDIAAGFTNTIDQFIYEIYRSTSKPITLALAYPSVEGAVQGCLLINDNCNNDGLFLVDEVGSKSMDFSEQTLIYNAILPVIASRDWITGISIRGYEPSVILHDNTSSIADKPAADVIQYWYSGLTGE